MPKGRTPAETAAMLRRARAVLGKVELVPARVEEELRNLAEADGWKAKDLLMALRFAVSGKKVTPPIVESMCVLGREACMARVEAAAATLGS